MTVGMLCFVKINSVLFNPLCLDPAVGELSGAA